MSSRRVCSGVEQSISATCLVGFSKVGALAMLPRYLSRHSDSSHNEWYKHRTLSFAMAILVDLTSTVAVFATKTLRQRR